MKKNKGFIQLEVFLSASCFFCKVLFSINGGVRVLEPKKKAYRSLSSFIGHRQVNATKIRRRENWKACLGEQNSYAPKNPLTLKRFV